MKPSGIALTLLLIVVLPCEAHAQTTGMISTSIGWLSLPMSDLNTLLNAHNYPGVSEHLLSIGLQIILGAQDLPLRLGMRGQLALALPGSGSSEESETDFVFLYGGIVTEFIQSITNVGQVFVGSLWGIGGAFLDLSRSRPGPATFDQALAELLQASGEFVRGYGVAQPYLSVSLSLSALLEKFDIQWLKSQQGRGKAVTPELSFTVGYVYAFPWGAGG